MAKKWCWFCALVSSMHQANQSDISIAAWHHLHQVNRFCVLCLTAEDHLYPVPAAGEQIICTHLCQATD